MGSTAIMSAVRLYRLKSKVLQARLYVIQYLQKLTKSYTYNKEYDDDGINDLLDYAA